MAVAGLNYECLLDAGTNGRIVDGGVFNKCSLLRGLDKGTLGIPGDTPLPFDEEHLPFVFLGMMLLPLGLIRKIIVLTGDAILDFANIQACF